MITLMIITQKQNRNRQKIEESFINCNLRFMRESANLKVKVVTFAIIGDYNECCI